MFFRMVKTVLKNLFTKPVTIAFPFGPREYAAGTRGKVVISIGQCVFCGMCKKCPTAAIVVERAKAKWEIDRFSCINCGACVEICPKKCLKMDTARSASAEKKAKELHIGILPVTQNKMI